MITLTGCRKLHTIYLARLTYVILSIEFLFTSKGSKYRRMTRLAERSNQATPSRAHTYRILQDVTSSSALRSLQKEAAYSKPGMRIVGQDDLPLYVSAKELDFQKPKALKYG